jgi:Fe-S oxidoreductase
MEIDTVDKKDYWKVVNHCYLCDLCYMTKCPYVPPHEWNLDFPHLMLRAKAFKYKKGDIKIRDRILTSTDTVGSIAGIPVINQIVNKVNTTPVTRKLLEKTLEIHQDAKLPEFHSKTLRQRVKPFPSFEPEPAAKTTGKLALFTTCYMNRNEPAPVEDLISVLQHNHIVITLPKKEQCCGMPKLELGNLSAVKKAKEANIPILAELVDEGWDLTALVPSCVLMFKQELPLMFPDDQQVQKVKNAFYDPFEYLMIRHKHDKLNTNFKQALGTVSYHSACHQRVQNIGQKTQELLSLIPDTKIETIARCSGHDGTYAVKKEYHLASMKIVKPIVKKIEKQAPDYYGSDCAMAGHHIENALKNGTTAIHPISLLRKAYGL